MLISTLKHSQTCTLIRQEEEEEEEDEEEDDEEIQKAIADVQVDPEEAQAKLKEFLKDYAEKNDGGVPSEEEQKTIKQVCR